MESQFLLEDVISTLESRLGEEPTKDAPSYLSPPVRILVVDNLNSILEPKSNKSLPNPPKIEDILDLDTGLLKLNYLQEDTLDQLVDKHPLYDNLYPVWEEVIKFREETALKDKQNQKDFNPDEVTDQKDAMDWKHLFKLSFFIQNMTIPLVSYFQSLTPEQHHQKYYSLFHSLFSFFFQKSELPTSEFFSKTSSNHYKSSTTSRPSLKYYKLLIHITPILEKIIYDLFFAVTVNPPPSMRPIMRDLLLTPEVSSFFTQMEYLTLRTLFGTPLGLNLRNILWHGFGSYGKIWENYFVFVLLFFLSLEKKYSISRVIENPKQKLDLIGKFLNYRTIISSNPEKYNTIIKFPVKNLNHSLYQHMHSTFQHSSFLASNCKAPFLNALSFFYRKKSPFALLTLMPFLEHSFRIAYLNLTSKSNIFPPPLSQAVIKEYYLILNNIFEFPSALTQLLGNGLVNFMHDMFLSSGGLRIRDKISHGEADLSTIPEDIIISIFAFVYCCCEKFNNSKHRSQRKEESGEEVQLIRSWFDAYRTQISPKHQILVKLEEFSQQLQKMIVLVQRLRKDKGPAKKNEDLPDLIHQYFSPKWNISRFLFQSLSADQPLVLTQNDQFIHLRNLMEQNLVYIPIHEEMCFERIIKAMKHNTKMMNIVEERIWELEKLVLERKARSRQRQMYEKLVDQTEEWLDLWKFVGSAVEKEVLEILELEKAEQKLFTQKIADLTKLEIFSEKGRVSAKESQWQEIIPQLVKFISATLSNKN